MLLLHHKIEFVEPVRPGAVTCFVVTQRFEQSHHGDSAFVLELFHLCWLGGNGFGAAKIILFFRCATTALQEFSPHPGLSLFAHRIPPVRSHQIVLITHPPSPHPHLPSAFSGFSPHLLDTKRQTSGNFPLKVPRFSSKVPHFRAFTPAFCCAPRTAHPPRAVRCIFPPHLRSATGVKRTSSIYSCTTSSDAGVPFPFRCRKVPSFLTTMRPSPRLLASFAFKLLLQLVQSLLTRPFSPVASSTITLSPRSSARLSSPLIGDTFSRHDTKAHDSHNNSMISLPFFHSNSTFVV